jgi:hypothetical protein
MNDPPESNSHRVVDPSRMKPQTTNVAEEIDSVRLEKSHNIHTLSPSENKDHDGSSRTNGINDNGKVDHAVNGRGSVEINNASNTPLKGQGNQDSKSYWEPIISPRPTDPWSKKVAATGDSNRTVSLSPKGEEKVIHELCRIYSIITAKIRDNTDENYREPKHRRAFPHNFLGASTARLEESFSGNDRARRHECA